MPVIVSNQMPRILSSSWRETSDVSILRFWRSISSADDVSCLKAYPSSRGAAKIFVVKLSPEIQPQTELRKSSKFILSLVF